MRWEYCDPGEGEGGEGAYEPPELLAWLVREGLQRQAHTLAAASMPEGWTLAGIRYPPYALPLHAGAGAGGPAEERRVEGVGGGRRPYGPEVPAGW